MFEVVASNPGRPCAVGVGVGLVAVRDVRAVVAQVTEAVRVHIGLGRIVDLRALVRGVRDAVAVDVREAVLALLTVAVTVAGAVSRTSLPLAPTSAPFTRKSITWVLPSET